jgi:6-carboxyhexanoate--CoA ligase
MHLGGAERLVPVAKAQDVGDKMAMRSRGYEPQPSQVWMTFESISPATITHVPCLPLHLPDVGDNAGAFDIARSLLIPLVSPQVLDEAFIGLTNGFASDRRVLRGAAIWNQRNGARLDTIFDRGIRVSVVDYAPEAEPLIDDVLFQAGLQHARTREAIAIASKVVWAGVLAEICWSDDAGYDTGYVSRADLGYVRLPCFRPKGAIGGRVFFVDGASAKMGALEHRLKREPVLIDAPLVVSYDLEKSLKR